MTAIEDDSSVARQREATASIRRGRNVVISLLGLIFCLPVGIVGLVYLLRARRLATSNVRQGRMDLARGKTWSWFAVSLGCALGLIGLTILIFAANGGAVFYTFFDYQLLRDNAGYILGGFLINIELFLVCEVLILIWALIVAVVREIPGPAAAPTRFIAAVYTDVFRGIPSLLVLLIVGLGLRRTGLPVLSDLSDAQAACLALTLNYGAYVAEVFRAGLHSVHWSQSAAARSLGLSYVKTMRLVVLPQAVRQVIPPLLNSFISLQKDTSLVTILGVLDSVNRAQAVSSYSASLAPYTGVAICFLVITLPLTRLTEYLAKRDRRARLSRS
ncbi:MAG: ABC transporter permease subunit [Rhizobiales bacterium]|nr:ABC transporter permease subunit [Hyphomicrobiales bacterium]